MLSFAHSLSIYIYICTHELANFRKKILIDLLFMEQQEQMKILDHLAYLRNY